MQSTPSASQSRPSPIAREDRENRLALPAILRCLIRSPNRPYTRAGHCCSLQDGEWNPRGPEWLQGTEVCRWVAIPWSRQLEAVIRTLNPDDQIELAMSNNDRLVYRVDSVNELSNEELQAVPTDSPCLLLLLAKADTETRWVLTALP